MLTITFCLEDGPKRYSKTQSSPSAMYGPPASAVFFYVIVFLSLSSPAIGRTLIPRYFRSIFEGGATELYYVLKHPKESFHNNFVSLDCDQCTMVTQNGKPMFTQVKEKGLRLPTTLPHTHSKTKLERSFFCDYKLKFVGDIESDVYWPQFSELV